jgi:ERCC4-type nuclease
VDVNKAVLVGGGNRQEGGEDWEEEDVKLAAKEILLSLPGINENNYHAVLTAVSNIAELSRMSEERLAPLIGPINAKKLHAFFVMKAS